MTTVVMLAGLASGPGTERRTRKNALHTLAVLHQGMTQTLDQLEICWDRGVIAPPYHLDKYLTTVPRLAPRASKSEFEDTVLLVRDQFGSLCFEYQDAVADGDPHAAADILAFLEMLVALVGGYQRHKPPAHTTSPKSA